MPIEQHIYIVTSHDREHAPSLWCVLMWCPTRNLTRRLRARGFKVKAFGTMIRTTAPHEVVVMLTDEGETVACHEHSSISQPGKYASARAKGRAQSKGRA